MREFVLSISSLGILFGGFWLVDMVPKQHAAKAFIVFLVLILGGWIISFFMTRSITRRQVLGELVKFNELNSGNSYEVVKVPQVVAVEEEINLSQKTLRLINATSIPAEDLPKLTIGRHFDIRKGRALLHEMWQRNLGLRYS